MSKKFGESGKYKLPFNRKSLQQNQAGEGNHLPRQVRGEQTKPMIENLILTEAQSSDQSVSSVKS